jgi:transcription elongation factor GreA
MEKIPMTASGYQRLVEELKNLKSVERPAVIRAISEARAHGDLSENAEYHSARERQGFIEGRIADIESRVSRAEVIDVSKLSGTRVMFGATVTIMDEETEQESTYQIVGEHEADVQRHRLSLTAPLARALIGKEIGDSVDVQTPGGIRSYEIISVKFID